MRWTMWVNLQGQLNKHHHFFIWGYHILLKIIIHLWRGSRDHLSFFWRSQWKQWRRQWQPTPLLLSGKSHGQRSRIGCSPWGLEESDTTEQLHFHFSLSCIGEGKGNPLQCSCLENPRDGGAWWAAVYGVAQSRTRLKRLCSSSSSNENSNMWNKHNTQYSWIHVKAPLIYRGISKTTSWKSFHKNLSNVTFMICNIHVDFRQTICLNKIQGHFEVK